MPKGVAFVRYDQRGEAENAVAAMNGKIPEGCTDPIQVSWSVSVSRGIVNRLFLSLTYKFSQVEVHKVKSDFW
jgi:hypothetical protein